jgi:hypothetical protein
MNSENLTINDRKYCFEYQEQAARTIITINAEQWTEQDTGNIKKLGQLLGQRLRVHIDPNLPQRLFVQKIEPKENPVSVPIDELKTIVKNCLDTM